VRVGIAACDCLLLAKKVWRETDGAFDVTIGPLLAFWRRKDKGESMSPKAFDKSRAVVGMNLLRIDAEQHTVTILKKGTQIDLGGIAKGYAVDQAAALLRDWDIRAALVSGGESSLFALGAPQGQTAWRIPLRHPIDQRSVVGEVLLRDKSLSGSGIRLHGHHIIDPRTGREAVSKIASWAAAPTAALSDALSTAFMIMAPREIETLSELRKDLTAIVMTPGAPHPKVVCFGNAGIVKNVARPFRFGPRAKQSIRK